MDHAAARAEETRAMERVLNATKQVQTAFAALQELEDAQSEFDAILNDLLDGNR